MHKEMFLKALMSEPRLLSTVPAWRNVWQRFDDINILLMSSDVDGYNSNALKLFEKMV